jgi:hypothetical protein
MEKPKHRSRRYPRPIIDHVQRRTREGWGPLHISFELEQLVKHSTIGHEGVERVNPLYQLPVPPYKTIQRWNREFRRNWSHTSDEQGLELDTWHSSMEPSPHDASIILSVLSEVAIRSQGSTSHFSKAMAAEVLRVTKLAPGIPPYIAWLAAWSYKEAQQTDDTATIEALDLFLGMKPWISADSWRAYLSLRDAGLHPLPSLLLDQTSLECSRQFGCYVDDQGVMHQEIR